MQWIDAHLHLFDEADEGTPPYAPTGGNMTAPLYLRLLDTHKPHAMVSVDFSKAPDASHVVRSLAHLKHAGMDAKGIIRGNPDNPQTFEWLERDDIAGVRLYAIMNCPDVSGAGYHRMFNLLRNNGQHICIFGKGDFLHGLLEQLPEDIPLLIDHLAMGDATVGVNDPDFQKTLNILSARKNRGQIIFFKGPSYRLGGTPKQAGALLGEIAKRFGASQLILGATDAPFAGMSDHFDFAQVGAFNMESLREAARICGEDVAEFMQAVLYDNAKQLYGF